MNTNHRRLCRAASLFWHYALFGALIRGLAAGVPLEAALESSPIPAHALGYPSRQPDFDVLPGFKNPPPGYGQVPFWWWTGDRLERDRLLWQIEQLHRMGVSGVQVNYAHEDTPGWPTYPADPPIFSDDWWDIWRFVADECGKRDMGIGLSGYTLDWPNGRSLVSRTIYSDPDIGGHELKVASRTPASAGRPFRLEVPAHTVSVRAYHKQVDGVLSPGPELPTREGLVEWNPDEGDYEVWVFTSEPKPGSLNPMHPKSGERVIEKFFQRFQDNAPGRLSKGLNYFFHDELQFGVGDQIWTDDFAEEFRRRKGYDVFGVLPALFADIGPQTPKARLDYMDVRIKLIQERYFIPIFNWHWSRGMIYGCDQGSRGRDPMEFGDYFSAVRWYTAPGHDTPGGHADLIKGKVSSSIAHLYQRPRVWLEGYHSLGWGAAPERLMQATCENYIYGCNLLNLHGLYYSTHGSFWEWAPPCYHFRMPYWEHMGTFFKYFERLSYLMSHGVHQANVAILYPVTTGQAGLEGGQAAEIAFSAGTRLFESGRDFIFIDDDSIERAEMNSGKLLVAGASYSAVVLPAMRAVRWATLEKLQQFQQQGGTVLAVGALPLASDRAGRNDARLDEVVKTMFGSTPQTLDDMPVRLQHLPPTVSSPKPLKATHRKIGRRDIFMVLGAAKNQNCLFPASGRAELWDPWTGETKPLHVIDGTEHFTLVRMPLSEKEAQIIAFTPGEPEVAIAETSLDEVISVEKVQNSWVVRGYAGSEGRRTASVRSGGKVAQVEGDAAPSVRVPLDGDWEFELKPTMDNRWGDFRLPIEDALMIGAEARIFKYAEEPVAQPAWESTDLDDSKWARAAVGFGRKFWLLGPLPASIAPEQLDTTLAGLTTVNPAIPVNCAGTNFYWRPYDFSWRWGREGDPGHQGWHGLKENVTDQFICLGKPQAGHNETTYGPEPGGTRYYLWTTAQVPTDTRVSVSVGGLTPAAVYVGGKLVRTNEWIGGHSGSTIVLARYEQHGRGHLVVRAPRDEKRERTPLAMRWHDDPGVLPLETRPATNGFAGWYRFTAPPGLQSMRVAAYGSVQAWVDGDKCDVSKGGALESHPGASFYTVDVSQQCPRSSRVALRISQARGYQGGAALPEPVALKCGVGLAQAGDWSQGTALGNYSGSAWYRRDIMVEPSQLKGRLLLDLGEVVATAEVRVNGQPAGIRVAPPWVFDITPLAREGKNRLEILICNTLANHYSTVPSKYQGSLRSGLIGPVSLVPQPLTILRERD